MISAQPAGLAGFISLLLFFSVIFFRAGLIHVRCMRDPSNFDVYRGSLHQQCHCTQELESPGHRAIDSELCD